MDVAAVMDSINNNQTNNSVKRSRSMTIFNDISKSKRITNGINKINVREYFSYERPFADIKIKFHHEIIWCNKALLAAASPVLCEELLKMNPKDEFLSFDDIPSDEFLLLLEFIYPVFNPEINEQTITCLIKLSHRFEFSSKENYTEKTYLIKNSILDILKHACQFYIMKYLSTIRHVSSKCQNSEDCVVNNNNNDDDESSKQHDLIEFHDGTCTNASDIIFNLCQWLQTYFYDDDTNILQSSNSFFRFLYYYSDSVIFILQQISIKNLDLVLNSMDINEEIKAYIYKERAQYLEEIHQIKYIA